MELAWLMIEILVAKYQNNFDRTLILIFSYVHKEPLRRVLNSQSKFLLNLEWLGLDFEFSKFVLNRVLAYH